MTTTKKANNPIRTCVSCREKKDKTSLLRWVEHNGKIYLDWRKSAPGRSVYTCSSSACVKKLYTLNSFSPKFFKGKPEFALDKESIQASILEKAEKSISYFFSLSLKSGVLIKGQMLIYENLKSNSAQFSLIILSSDISDRVKTKIYTLAGENSDSIILFSNKNSLGRMTGSRAVGTLALKKSEISEKIRYYIEIINNFESGEMDANT